MDVEETNERIRAHLRAMTTRALMAYRQRAFDCGGRGYDPTDGGNSYIPMEWIKEELAKREHVPAKTEAKVLRRLMAKHKLTAGQVRATPKLAAMLSNPVV